MRGLCVIMAAVLLACWCLSCNPEGSIAKSSVDDIQYSKADYLFELGTHSGLDEDTEWQIIQAYLQKLQSDGEHGDLTINDVWVEQFYGVYCPTYLYPDRAGDLIDFLRTEYKNDNNLTVYAVRIGEKGNDYGTEPRDVIINVYGKRTVVRYYDNSRIFLWDKGHLYDIENGRDNLYNQFLAAWDIRKIINRHNGLDLETDTMVRKDIVILSGGPAENDVYDWQNMKYLGTYNGYTVLTWYLGHSSAVHEQIIGGVLFLHPLKEDRVIAWKEGAIYELNDLYKQGLITREDLVTMAYFHEGRWTVKEEN